MIRYVPTLLERIWVCPKVARVTCWRRPTDHGVSLMTLQQLNRDGRCPSLRARSVYQVSLPFRWDAANGS
jgi:hypothetical protein